jgi:enediyne biosynthesis protein E4
VKGADSLTVKWVIRAIGLAAVLLSAYSQSASELKWVQGAGFRSAEVNPGTGGKPGFTLMDPQFTAVLFTNVLQGDAYATNAVAHNGSGVAIGDIDGDGWQDIYFCSLQGRNRLYRNLGNWHFEEVDPGPAACLGQFSTGATFADVDGDGDLDLLVNGIGVGTRLFLNDGKGHFTEVTDSGLSHTASATSLTLGDIDGDGDLDLYCTHYIDQMHLLDPTTRFSIAKRDGHWVVAKVNDQPTTVPRLKDRFEVLPDGSVRELPEVHGLYRNDGHGHFTPIQFEPGVFLNEDGQPIPPFRDWGLSAMFRDINGDGAPDLYVCNDNVSPDRIWINTGKGTFRLIDRFSFRHTSRSAMGLDFADVNRDGYDDLVVLDMVAREHGRRMMQLVKTFPDPEERERVDSRPQYNRNTLFLGRPDGTFAEAALMAGVAATDWSWCPIFLDVDLDGYEDLLVSNGFEADVMDQDKSDEIRKPRGLPRRQLMRLLEFFPRWHTANAAFRNRHDGTFEPISQEWGFNQIGTSQGMALGDLDNDGDLDLVVNNLNEVAGLYRNNAAAGRIAVRLKGLPPNTQGIGARLRLVGGPVIQSQEMICGGRYLSGDQAERVFAADAGTGHSYQLEVRWRNGDQSTLTNLQANHIYEVDQAGALHNTGTPAPKPETNTWFKDATAMLGHLHVEVSFDDWAQQPCLPRRLSRLGPGVSWYDIDGDGWEDLMISSSKDGKLGVYHNDQGRGFHSIDTAPKPEADQTTVLGWSDGGGNRKLVIGLSNYRSRPQGQSEVAIYSLTNMAAPQRLTAGNASIGPLAMADVDGDGTLDLFVGGRFNPGRYPEPASSTLWLNRGGKLELSRLASQPFESIGLVSAATFADLDGDGWPDLVLALEWGPIRVFRNNHGKFEDVTVPWGFEDKKGWWTSITVGDFDGDGRLDLAAGNWGRNSMYELNPGAKGVFFGDWNSDGKLALIEAWPQGTNWFPVHNRNWLAATVPVLAAPFPSHESFSKASVAVILGERYQTARKLEANELRSGIFLNRGDHFEWKPLPNEAQLAPVFSINVGDADGDGVEDLFLSQNYFGAIPENIAREAFSRDDAGRGLWLRGDGRGSFTAVDGSITGVKVYGEQRGAALADFNHDGRVDLAVSQNNGATKLYLNQAGKRGLRVTLHGLGGNPDAIGALLRLCYPGGRMGPARTIAVGSGYWSQEAATQVLGCAEAPVGLWIRWPGGREQTVPLERDVWEVNVAQDQSK